MLDRSSSYFVFLLYIVELLFCFVFNLSMASANTLIHFDQSQVTQTQVRDARILAGKVDTISKL